MALSAPQQNGDQLNQSEVENHTMLVCPTEFIPHIPTVHTKAGEQSPAIRCNVIDLTDGALTKYTGVLWFGVISNSLKRQIGETVLGRMVKGQATPGKNPPWQLADIMTEQAWVDYANQWLDSPDGKAWEIDCINEVNRAANAAQVAGAAATTQPAAGTPAPVQTAPATAPPAPPASAAAPAAPSGPPAVAGPPMASPASNGAALPPGLEALIAALPAEQQEAARTVMRAQSGAAS